MTRRPWDAGSSNQAAVNPASAAVRPASRGKADLRGRSSSRGARANLVIAPCVIRQDQSRCCSDFAAGGQVDEFIGTMGVGVGPKDPGDQKLSLRKFLAEHPDEGNGATFTHHGGVAAESGF